MKTNRYVVLNLILISLFFGCKTIQFSQPGQKTREGLGKSGGEVRGFAVLPEIWVNDDPVIVQKNIIKVMDKVAAANYNSVFLISNDNIELPPVIIDEAHKNNLKVYVCIDLPEPTTGIQNKPLSQLKTCFKERVRNLVTKYNMDGLSILTSDNSPDIIEDLAVEAMLLKPYLVNSIVYSGLNGNKKALSYLEEGGVDFILPKTDFRITDPDKIPNRFTDKISIPDNLKKITPEQVVGLDLSALFPDQPGGQTVYINKSNKSRLTDSEGKIGFITSNPDTILLRIAGGDLTLLTENWNIPYNYKILPDGSVNRESPWVEFRNMPEISTGLPGYDFLCKTEYPARVWINDDSLKQYKTGIFFKKIDFNEGPNRVRATIKTADSLSTFYENEYVYHKVDKTKKPYPLWINEKTVEPSYDIELLPEDVVRFTFQGSKKQDAFIEVSPGKVQIQCSREDYEDYSLYRCEIPMRKLKVAKQSKIVLKLIPKIGTPDNKIFELALKNTVTAREPDDFPFVRIAKENSRLIYNLGAPRLGGPIRSELGPGVVLKTNGKTGENYRIRLSRTENGFINQSDVELMPAGTVQPSYYITSMSCSPGKDADVLTIPYLEPVPYEIYPDPNQQRFIITLFGVESSSTWITHLAGRRIIDKITWQQTTPETYQIIVNLKTPEMWGYSIRPEGKRLVLRLKYPPEYNLKNEKPLTGLKIAIEAGHGGSGMGAIGLSGLIEKNINLDLSRRFGELCKSMGAEIIQIRDSDKDMTLIEKRNIAIESDADLLISIHANAGGGGYLQVAGTSTYYNNPFWAPLAENIYNRLLETGLKEFGVVGSFNYTVIRASQMPAILVEQAFMSNAEDEEKLADPQFRQQLAQKIYEGILDYLKYMKP